MSRSDHLSPRKLLWVLLLMQLLVWTLVPLLTHTSMPLDVVREGLAWGREWEWGYHKHPPLPSWLVESSFRLAGDAGPFFLGQLSVAATFLFVFLLGREVLDEKDAVVGVILLVGIYYFSLPTAEFNHNVALMPVWAALIFFFYKALNSTRLLWWVLLGSAAGIGLLSKYTILLLLALMFVYGLARPAYRKQFAGIGPYLSMGVALIIVAPHLFWLLENDFPSLAYLSQRSDRIENVWMRPAKSLEFLLAQLAALLPMAVLLWSGGLLGKKPALIAAQEVKIESRGREFLLVFGLGPVLIASIIPLFSGAGLRSMWGMPMLSLSGLLAVVLLGNPWRISRLRQFLLSSLLLFLFLAAVYSLKGVVSARYAEKPTRTAWPDLAIAQRMERNWKLATGCELKIITSDGWLGGLVAMRSSSRPSVFLDGDFAKAPWITPGDLTREGSLVIWMSQKEGVVPEAYLGLPGFSYQGIEVFEWPRNNRQAKPLVLEWGVVPGRCSEPLKLRQ